MKGGFVMYLLAIMLEVTKGGVVVVVVVAVLKFIPRVLVWTLAVAALRRGVPFRLEFGRNKLEIYDGASLTCPVVVVSAVRCRSPPPPPAPTHGPGRGSLSVAWRRATSR